MACDEYNRKQMPLVNMGAIDPVRREVSTWLASSEPRAKGDKPLANELSELVWDITLCWHGEPRASPAA